MHAFIRDGIILDNGYEGIRDQDGWETLEFTVRDAYDAETADCVLKRLQVLQEKGLYLTISRTGWNDPKG